MNNMRYFEEILNYLTENIKKKIDMLGSNVLNQ